MIWVKIQMSGADLHPESAEDETSSGALEWRLGLPHDDERPDGGDGM